MFDFVRLWTFSSELVAIQYTSWCIVEYIYWQEWEKPKPGRRPEIFPQFSPMKTPLPPPLPADPPEEDEEEDEEKREEEEDPEKEEPEQ